MTILEIYKNFILRNLILTTILFWIVFICVYDETRFEGYTWVYMVSSIATGLFPCIVWIMGFNLFIMKPFLFKKKIKTFYVLFLIYWTAFYYFMNWYFPFVDLGKFKTLHVASLVVNGIVFYFLHLVIMKNISQKDKDIINFKSELSFLKQQLNPHFLLNAMNNLYGESLSKPDKLPERILNLSDLLRYQIEATKKDYVLVGEEINFIKKYTEYYRFQNERLVITQNYESAFENYEIPPLFFLPLVENAVKFSAETAKPFIVIDLKLINDNLTFVLKNNFLEVGSRLSSTGIGIENLKRRLEVYGLKHEFICQKENDIFIVKLSIWNLPIVA